MPINQIPKTEGGCYWSFVPQKRESEEALAGSAYYLFIYLFIFLAEI
jgi:hypothetical protein